MKARELLEELRRLPGGLHDVDAERVLERALRQVPRRRFELVVHAGGDTREDLEDAALEVLGWVQEMIENQAPIERVLGGYSRNFSAQLLEQPDMTHEKYFEQIDRYLGKVAA